MGEQFIIMESCVLVSDQHMNNCPMGLCEASPMKTVSHLAKTSVPWDRAEYYLEHTAFLIYSLL